MNFLTFFVKEFSDHAEAFISSLSQHGGGATGDKLIIIGSIYHKEETDAYAEKLQPFFDEVDVQLLSLKTLDDNTPKEFINELVCRYAKSIKMSGLTAFIPYGYVPTAKGWARQIREDYNLGEKELYGESSGGEYPVLYGMFVVDAKFFSSCPSIPRYIKGLYFMEKAKEYTKSRFKSANRKLPFAFFPIESVQTETKDKPKPKPKKKASKKQVKRKTAKKAARAKPAEASPDLGEDASTPNK